MVLDFSLVGQVSTSKKSPLDQSDRVYWVFIMVSVNNHFLLSITKDSKSNKNCGHLEYKHTAEPMMICFQSITEDESAYSLDDERRI